MTKFRQNKYRAKGVHADGQFFSSKGEYRRYLDLKVLEQAQHITGLELHPRYPITVNGFKVCTVVLDFAYYDCRENCTVYEDYKGFYTPESKLRHKLFMACYGTDVKITGRSILK